MIGLRSIISGCSRVKTILCSKVQTPAKLQKFSHHDGPIQPFDNMPFSIPNRYVATVVFSVFFGIGLWAPYIIVWYAMAKRTL